MVFRGPSSLTLVWIMLATSSRFDTSAAAKQALRPRASISLTTSEPPFVLALISLMHTSYSSAARRSAMLLPIPLLEPVTITLFPSFDSRCNAEYEAARQCELEKRSLEAMVGLPRRDHAALNVRGTPLRLGLIMTEVVTPIFSEFSRPNVREKDKDWS